MKKIEIFLGYDIFTNKILTILTNYFIFKRIKKLLFYYFILIKK